MDKFTHYSVIVEDTFREQLVAPKPHYGILTNFMGFG